MAASRIALAAWMVTVALVFIAAFLAFPLRVSGRQTPEGPYRIRLPYPVGSTYTLVQGNDVRPGSGDFTHSRIPGEKYAFDFDMPNDGSGVIVAVADGVIKPGFVYDESTMGGCNQEYLDDGNYVVVHHTDADGNEDGTTSLYLHIASALVKPTGNEPISVRQGEPIAVSDSTGLVCGAHLHFQVQKACSSWHCESIPVRFDDLELDGDELVEGTFYASGNRAPSASGIRLPPDLTGPGNSDPSAQLVTPAPITPKTFEIGRDFDNTGDFTVTLETIDVLPDGTIRVNVLYTAPLLIFGIPEFNCPNDPHPEPAYIETSTGRLEIIDSFCLQNRGWSVSGVRTSSDWAVFPSFDLSRPFTVVWGKWGKVDNISIQ